MLVACKREIRPVLANVTAETLLQTLRTRPFVIFLQDLAKPFLVGVREPVEVMQLLPDAEAVSIASSQRYRQVYQLQYGGLQSAKSLEVPHCGLATPSNKSIIPQSVDLIP